MGAPENKEAQDAHNVKHVLQLLAVYNYIVHISSLAPSLPPSRYLIDQYTNVLVRRL